MPADLLVLLSPTNIILFIVVFTRLSGLMMTAPLISTYPIPIQVKVWFMAAISFIIFPMVMAASHFAIPTSMPELLIILLKEFAIGYIIGFIANLVFISIEIAADLLSIQMGFSAAQALNPMTGNNSPMMAQIFTILASMVFIGIHGYQWLFSAVYKSFETVPPGYEIMINATMAKSMIMATCQMFPIALSIALPIFAVLLITDVLLGFTSKMMPKMNIFMVSLPLKIYVGLVLLIMLIKPLGMHVITLMEKVLTNIMYICGGL